MALMFSDIMALRSERDCPFLPRLESFTWACACAYLNLRACLALRIITQSQAFYLSHKRCSAMNLQMFPTASTMHILANVCVRTFSRAVTRRHCFNRVSQSLSITLGIRINVGQENRSNPTENGRDYPPEVKSFYFIWHFPTRQKTCLNFPTYALFQKYEREGRGVDLVSLTSLFPLLAICCITFKSLFSPV